MKGAHRYVADHMVDNHWACSGRAGAIDNAGQRPYGDNRDDTARNSRLCLGRIGREPNLETRGWQLLSPWRFDTLVSGSNLDVVHMAQV